MTDAHSETITIAIIAGEHSGDAYGAKIIENIKLHYPSVKFVGVGGPKMHAAGLKVLMPMDMLSIIGVFNVIKKIPTLYKAKNKLISEIIEHKPVLFIGIDAPDFNLIVAKNLKKKSKDLGINIKNIQYISPTIWAWRPWRINLIRRAVDLVLCIFPFEEKIYLGKKVSARFVGHPLANKLKCKTALEKENSIKKLIALGVDTELSHKTIIGIYPGSRSSELNFLAPVFIETMLLLNDTRKDVHFIIPVVSKKMDDLWHKYFTENIQASILPITVVKVYECHDIDSIDIMRASDIILCASGTTTLESFLINTPMVVAYKVSRANELLMKLLLRVKYVAMPNILSDILTKTQLVPEYLQGQVTSHNLSLAVINELKNLNNTSTIEKWSQVRDYLISNKINHEKVVTESISELI